MQLHVSVLHHDYPAKFREHCEQKLQELTRYADRVISLKAMLERVHAEHRVELVASVGHGAVLVVDARADHAGGALDEALGRMERLLERHFKKHLVARRRERHSKSHE